jgi:hypothetical protein
MTVTVPDPPTGSWTVWAAGEHIHDIFILRAFWRARLFLCVALFVSLQWGDMETLLLPFLERHYGENVPIYLIHSINLWGCVIGPPLVAAYTANYEAFRVIKPGLWICALAPIFLVVYPSVLSSAAWVLCLTLGEILWGPRSNAFVAGLAPDGREGIFLAFLSLKNVISSLPASALNGWLNDKYQPNCKTCRDPVGHFCSTPCQGIAPPEIEVCCSEKHICPQFDTCPASCADCPGWSSEPQKLWTVVLVLNLVSPILTHLFVQFFRGEACTCCGVEVCAVDQADFVDLDEQVIGAEFDIGEENGREASTSGDAFIELVENEEAADGGI